MPNDGLIGLFDDYPLAAYKPETTPSTKRYPQSSLEESMVRKKYDMEDDDDDIGELGVNDDEEDN